MGFSYCCVYVLLCLIRVLFNSGCVQLVVGLRIVGLTYGNV